MTWIAQQTIRKNGYCKCHSIDEVHFSLIFANLVSREFINRAEIFANFLEILLNGNLWLLLDIRNLQMLTISRNYGVAKTKTAKTAKEISRENNRLYKIKTKQHVCVCAKLSYTKNTFLSFLSLSLNSPVLTNKHRVKKTYFKKSSISWADKQTRQSLYMQNTLKWTGVSPYRINYFKELILKLLNKKNLISLALGNLHL